MDADAVLCEAIEWWLWRTRGIGPRTMSALDDVLDGDFASLGATSATELDRVLREASVRSHARGRITPEALSGAQEALTAARQRLPPDSNLLWHRDDGFPGRLRDLPDPPRFLFVRGSRRALLGAETVSMVGSRSARVDGVRQTREIAAALAADGRVVVSGGAIGVDAAAHTGAVESGGQTVVILPGGIDKPSPSKNRRLFRRALDAGGCLISEYPPGSRVRKHNFHRRNRLIAALGDWLVVVRAGQQSGTMITARAAAEIGRPILTMAGPDDDSRYAGCVDLLAAGAGCVRGSADVIRIVESASPERYLVDTSVIARAPEASRGRASDQRPTTQSVDRKARAKLGASATDALALIEKLAEGGPVHADELRRTWSEDAAGLETALLELELVGIVSKAPGKNAYSVVK